MFRGTLVAVMASTPVLAGGQESGPAAGAGQESTGSQEEVFLTLREAVGIALSDGRDLREARYGLEVAEEQVSEAWGSVFPRVDLSASYTRNLAVPAAFLPKIIFDPDADPDELIPVRFGADNIWNLNLALDQPLFDARAFIGVGTAGRFKNLQEEMVRGRSQQVVTRVRIAYYDLLLAQEQHRLIDNSVRRVRESLAETRALNRAGLASEYDVLRLEVELANLEPNLRRAENAMAQSRRQLGVELSLDDLDAVRVAGSLATMDLEDLESNDPDNRAILAFNSVTRDNFQDRSQVLQFAQESRSDIRQLELTEDLRQAELRIEQVEYLPTVSVFGTYGINAQQNGDPDFFANPDLRAYTRQIGLEVSVPVFTGFQRDARIDQKRAALRQAETQTYLVRDQVTSQVSSLLDLAQEARLRSEAQRLAVTQAQRGFEIARAQYREGLGSQLELTDAEVALRQSEFNYAQAVYDYLAARAQLDEAAGRVPAVDVPLQFVTEVGEGDGGGVGKESGPALR